MRNTIFFILLLTTFNCSSQNYFFEEFFGATNSNANSLFGSYITQYENTALITSETAPYVSVFEKNQNHDWIEIQVITEEFLVSSHRFGSTHSIYQDNIAIGSYNYPFDSQGNNHINGSGAVFLYSKNEFGEWESNGILTAPDRTISDNFGKALMMYGEYLVIGAKNNGTDENYGNHIQHAGSAYIYKINSENEWVFLQKIVASDRSIYHKFGKSVAINEDFIVIGAYNGDSNDVNGNVINNSGTAYIYELNSNNLWVEKQKIYSTSLSTGEQFGISASIDNNTIVIGAQMGSFTDSNGNFHQNVGVAYVFILDADQNWVEHQALTGTNPINNYYSQFSFSVSNYGDYIIVGAPFGTDPHYLGSSYLYYRNTDGYFDFIQKFEPFGLPIYGAFGYSVSIFDDKLLIGLPYYLHTDTDGSVISGLAYSYSTQLLNLNEQPTREFIVYPNPVYNQLKVKNINHLNINNISILNSLGQKIHNFQVSESSDLSISLEFLQNGLYFIEIYTDTSKITKKIIKQ